MRPATQMSDGINRVLFVTGDRSDVGLIHRLLPEGASRWRPVHATDAASAFAALDEGPPIHAVALDTSLRGVDGGAFLSEVRDRFPRIARFSFSDGAEPVDGRGWTTTIVLGTISKKATAAEVQSQLDRATSLHTLITRDAVLGLVGGIDRLPPLPSTYRRLLQVASNPDTSIREIAEIVESDPVMTLKVLQLVNSAFFGLMRRVPTVAGALSLLGLELLKSLLLAAHVMSAFEKVEVEGFSAERFQLYSMRVARLAHRFAGSRRLEDEALTSGILHDIGELIFALRRPQEFSRVMQRVTEGGERQCDVEAELLGANHAEAGACLLASWGIPFSVVECVAFHHTPSAVAGDGGHVLAAVHAADALVDIVTCGAPEERLDRAFLERAGFAEEIPKWRAIVEDTAKTWTYY